MCRWSLGINQVEAHRFLVVNCIPWISFTSLVPWCHLQSFGSTYVQIIDIPDSSFRLWDSAVHIRALESNLRAGNSQHPKHPEFKNVADGETPAAFQLQEFGLKISDVTLSFKGLNSNH
ncbi:hypothetical protein R1flu_016780 [Riccia fluitans]|uniref:Uncharacterized protein n=1 Tax=Riccia fluitans TaxID=41844 RepID=A0ABD1YQX1_9MARC